MEKKHRHFPDEFKWQALERVEANGLPFFEVTAELGVHESQLCRWARQFGQAGALTTRHRPSREVAEPGPADLVTETPRLPACSRIAAKVGHGMPDLRADGPTDRASSASCNGRRQRAAS